MFYHVLERGVPPVVVRALIYMYEEQYAWVRWGRVHSDRFSILNGTRQGSHLSPSLWAVYCDPLLAKLRATGVGCYMGGLWVGAVMYCDDLLIMAPTRRTMAILLGCVSSGRASTMLHSLQILTPAKVKAR